MTLYAAYKYVSLSAEQNIETLVLNRTKKIFL